jgi:hypothetical protein
MMTPPPPPHAACCMDRQVPCLVLIEQALGEARRKHKQHLCHQRLVLCGQSEVERQRALAGHAMGGAAGWGW